MEVNPKEETSHSACQNCVKLKLEDRPHDLELHTKHGLLTEGGAAYDVWCTEQDLGRCTQFSEGDGNPTHITRSKASTSRGQIHASTYGHGMGFLGFTIREFKSIS